VLTGTQVLLLVVSETGLVYTFTTPKLQPLVTKAEGKNLIQVISQCPHTNALALTPLTQACLNAPSPTGGNENGLDDQPPLESPEDASHAQMQQRAGSMAQNQAMPPGYMTADQAAYQQYLQQQQIQQSGQYPMPPQARMPQHPQQHHQ